MIDWAAKWFEIRAEMGQSDMATMMYKDRGSDWQEKHFRHRETDGFGKIKSLLKEEGISIEPPIRPLKRPSVFSGPYWLLKGLLQHPKLEHNPWKHFSLTSPSAEPNEVSYWHLSQEENQALQVQAKKAGLNLGFYILSKVDEIIKTQLYKNPNDKSTWLCPVDVRGAFPEVPQSQNCVSFVVVPIEGQGPTAAAKAFANYRANLKKKTYWGFWELYQIGKWIGVSGMRKLAEKSQGKSFWMGSFSDLGIWNQDILRHSHVKDRFWAIAPPGSSSYPIGLTTIEWCGNRSISLKIHPSICETKNTLVSEKILAEFKKSVVAS